LYGSSSARAAGAKIAPINIEHANNIHFNSTSFSLRMAGSPR